MEDHDRFVKAANDLFGRYDVNILSWIKKFGYLKQCLPEKDKKKLLTYTQDQTGYANFWADLKISYGTKTDKIFHWKRRLEKLPWVQKLPDGKVKVASLRSHYEEAKITLRHLAKHGKDGKRCYEEFLLLLAGKLDQQSAIEWGMYFKNEKLDEGDKDPLHEYQNWIKVKLDAMAANYNDYKMCNPKEFNGNNGNKGKNSEKLSTEVNKTEVSSKNKKKKSKRQVTSTDPKHCPFHPTQAHLPATCNNIGDFKQVWHRIYSCLEQICTCCLRAGHIVNSCPDKKVCSKGGCEKYHHPKLHKAAQSEHFVSWKDWKTKQDKDASTSSK